MENVLERKISDLSLTLSQKEAFSKNGIETIRDLLDQTGGSGDNRIRNTAEAKMNKLLSQIAALGLDVEEYLKDHLKRQGLHPNIEYLFIKNKVYWKPQLESLSADSYIQIVKDSDYREITKALKDAGFRLAYLDDTFMFDDNMSSRLRNALIKEGICTVESLKQLTSDQLYYIRNVGEASIAEAVAYIANHEES